MKNVIFSAAVLLLTSNSSWAHETTQTILKCDKGAAILKVDLNERRTVFLEIANLDALEHLSRVGGMKLKDSEDTFQTVRFDQHRQVLTIRMRVNEGIFDSRQFQEAGASRVMRASLNHGGLKFQILSTEGFCQSSEPCRGSESCSGGTPVPCEIAPYEKAHWYFNTCEYQ